MQTAPDPLSLNARAARLADAVIADASALSLGVARGPGGETLVDCGHRHPGGTEAGLGLARICLAGLGEVALIPSGQLSLPWSVLVRTSHPALACLGSQYAGWHLSTADGSSLMGSGPARSLARREPLFDDLPHEEQAERAILVLEGDVTPDDHLAQEVAQACRLHRQAFTLFHAPTGSLAGCVQIAARVLECAVQKARHVGFPLADLTEALGTAPVAPPHPETRAAMGRANDAIIYGGRVQLFVGGDRAAARDLARALPSRTAPEWGRSFAEVFEAAGGDFARIDPGLFAPAEVAVTALATGETFRSGRVDALRLHEFLDPG
jgi:methenyltetrahydromethanopterin cyclohydrolase